MVEIKDTYCVKCGNHTESIEPTSIDKIQKNRYGFRTTCSVCKLKKYQFIKKAYIKNLPEEIRNMEERTTQKGGFLPLIPLLGLIFGGIAAASGVARTVANTVISKQKANEEQRHNEESEKIMREVQGSAILNETSSSEKPEVKKQKKSEEDKIEKCIKYLQKRGYIVSINISSCSSDSEN